MAVKWQANQFTMVELEAGVENKPGVGNGDQREFRTTAFSTFRGDFDHFPGNPSYYRHRNQILHRQFTPLST